ncbi:MAG: glutamine--fructose-6-phosphate aminotransferase, partial [Candidatus Bathyarchaeota archaeon]
MCGIFGVVQKEGDVAPLIHDGLKRLEYRGYDSVGFVTLHSGSLQVRKDAGRIDDVVERLKMVEMKGSMGVGHTRWATHGAPEMVNAHPHTDCHENIALVHNGVIENFMELKEEMIAKGHTFKSRTDTEVIAHLIEEEMKGDIGLDEAVLNSLRRLDGSYAIAVVSTSDPDKILCARQESPLVIGVSDKGAFCASDAPAMLPFTNKVVYLRNGELAIIDTEGYDIRTVREGAPVERELEEITWSLEMAEKQGYPHFMLKEILEPPY